MRGFTLRKRIARETASRPRKKTSSLAASPPLIHPAESFHPQEIKAVAELPFSYGLYHCHYDFPNGPPKTHEHDAQTPKGFGLFHNGRLALYYTYESNPSDGWNDPQVHGDPPEKREEALRFGTNIIVWALTH